MQTRDTLARIGLFADVLSEKQIDDFAAKCQIVDYPAGAVLMTEGDFGTFMVAIVSGRLSVTVAGIRHELREVTQLGSGDVVGEMSLMTGARRSATVTAIEPTRVVEITKVALESMFARAPDLLEALGAMLVLRRARLVEISEDESAWRFLGIRPEEIVQSMRRFFGRPPSQRSD